MSGWESFLLRALVGGLFFLVLGIAIQLVVSRFLPELSTTESGDTGGLSDLNPSTTGAGESMSGNHIDIASEDEAAPPSYTTQQDAGGVSHESESAGSEAASALHPAETSTFVSSGSGVKSGNSPIIGDSVSGLPDLDSFSGTFQSSSGDDSEEESAAEGGDSQAYSSFASSSRGDGDQIAKENDPADIAKAIRTVLNRDNG